MQFHVLFKYSQNIIQRQDSLLPLFSPNVLHLDFFFFFVVQICLFSRNYPLSATCMCNVRDDGVLKWFKILKKKH